MGIIKDLKNIFFGASSVTKSATEKATDFVKEEGDLIIEKTKDLASSTGETILEKTSGLKDSILDNSSDLLKNTKEKISDLTIDFSESEIGSKISSKSSDLADKAGEISENVGEIVMDKGAILLDKSKDLSEDVGGRVLNAKDKILEKAEDVKDQLTEKLGETMDKADAWAEHEKANPKPEFAEDTLDASGSLLEGTDDFFSKADKFAGGDYGAFSEGKITLDQNEKLPSPKEFDSLPPATGFTDLDGDGNEIIDDAIIDE